MATMIRSGVRREPGRVTVALAVAGLLVAVLVGGCACGPAAVVAPLPFRSDGCTGVPDGVPGDPHAFRGACVRHDLAYWRGGTWAERLAADRAFRDEIRAQGRPVRAAVMFTGVRLGGVPFLPTSWRWGFAWPYGRFYRPVTANEDERLARSLEDDPPPPGTWPPGCRTAPARSAATR